MKFRQKDQDSDILLESAIFDYLAGQMSEQQKQRFELKLANSAELQAKVESERRLRSAIISVADSELETDSPVSENGFSALLATLDELGESPKNIDSLVDVRDDAAALEPEYRLVQENDHTLIRDNDGQPGSKSSSNVVPFSLFSKKGLVGFASIAAGLIVAIGLFVGNPSDDQGSEFVLLSNDSNSGQSSVSPSDFKALVNERRVAQLWIERDALESFSNGLSEELQRLFTELQLQPIVRAADAWIVMSPVSLSNAALAEINRHPKVQEISLISNNDRITIDSN